ncbi:hypothetical protein ACFY05_41290 [Microtetraspora fusca]|uniref:VOC domain-containing protein n=1 Tax=Microtetraspora fusca TaxID=1997 RepID=A0ABW6VM46_MICFU
MCRLRNDARVFRLDRIASAVLTDESAPRRPVDQAQAADGTDYRIVSYAGDDRPRGGVRGIDDGSSGYAIFTVAVRDVEEACATIEDLGGKVEDKVVGSDASPDCAYARDSAGNLFGIFTPKAR